METKGAGVRVREYRPSDRKQVLQIFREGMVGTIQPGLRDKLINSKYMVAYFVLVSSIFYHFNYSGTSLPVVSTKPHNTIYDDGENNINHTYDIHVDMFYWTVYIFSSTVFPYLLISFLSYYVANDYVKESITKKDLKNIENYYLKTKSNRNMFWVACQGTEIVGTVALDEIKTGNVDGWEVGDGELRRMSVKKTSRGKGVARLLFSALKEFCLIKKYNRIVLSTSELQKAACKMYSSAYNFQIEKTVDWNGIVNIKYFKLEI